MKGIWETLFIVNGFSNWKDAMRIFKKHDTSDVHKYTVEIFILYHEPQDILVKV